MKGIGVVFTDPLKVSFEEVSIPEPEPEDVLIDVDYSWISIGTESSFLRCERIAGEIPYREGDRPPYPQISGYQKTGTVIWAGSEAHGWKVGDRVFATLGKVEGMSFPDGGHVTPSLTHRSQVWKLPDGADTLAYSGLVLTQVGYNCGIRPHVAEGDVAVVIGDGLVGHWAAQTLLKRKANVVVLGRHDERLSLLPAVVAKRNVRQMGMDEALRHEAGDIAIIVDTVGSMQSVMELLDRSRRNVHLVSAGFLGMNGLVDIQRLRQKEVTLHCPSGWTRERVDGALAGISEGWLQTLPLITHRYPAEQAEEAWRIILDKGTSKLGVILEWKR